MLVVRVTWKFLGKVEKAKSPPPAFDFDKELKALANVVDDRTHYYWIAWLLALSAFVLTSAWVSWYAAIAAVVVAAVMVIFR